MSIENLNISHNYITRHSRDEVKSSERIAEYICNFISFNLVLMHLNLSGMNLQHLSMKIAGKAFFSSSLVCLHLGNNNISEEDKTKISSTFGVS